MVSEWMGVLIKTKPTRLLCKWMSRGLETLHATYLGGVAAVWRFRPGVRDVVPEHFVSTRY